MLIFFFWRYYLRCQCDVINVENFHESLGKPIDFYWFKMSNLSWLVVICVHCFFLKIIKLYKDICYAWISRTSAESFFS